MNDEAVTEWFRRLTPSGDSEAAQRLWDHYYTRLLHLARQKLGPRNRRMSDEEDVVLSAFDSFYRAAAAGRFPRLDDREDLWRLLVTITARKAADHRKHQQRQKRGGGDVRGESAFDTDRVESTAGIDGVVGNEPTPEFAAEVAEQYGWLLTQLGDETLRRIASLRLENYSLMEIAEALGCSLRTVKRRLAMIRTKWEGAIGPQGE